MKKEKNDTNTKVLVTIGIFILLATAFLLFFLVTTTIVPTEHKIHKEECHNESYWHMYTVYVMLDPNVSYPLKPNEKIECLENTCYVYFKDYVERCETIEVDYIEEDIIKTKNNGG